MVDAIHEGERHFTEREGIPAGDAAAGRGELLAGDIVMTVDAAGDRHREARFLTVRHCVPFVVGTARRPQSLRDVAWNPQYTRRGRAVGHRRCPGPHGRLLGWRT